MLEPSVGSFNDMWNDRVAFAFPNSAAMDVAAGGNGPSATALPQVVTGNTPAIDRHTTQLTQLLRRLVGLLQDLERAKSQLRQVWPAGTASDRTQNKLGTSFGSYDRVIQSGYTFVRELQAAAAQLKTAQTGYSSVIGAVNPTVASLWSSQYGKPAATALSTTTTSTLNAFLTAIAGLLKTIGSGNIGSIVSGLAQVLGGLEKMLSQGNGASTASAVPAVPLSLSSAVLVVPPAVSPVASLSGQAAIGTAGTGTAAPYPVGSSASFPPAAANPNANMWVPVDGSASVA